MAELALTVDRRRELIELLGDDARLRTESSKLSEYLDMSPQLAGTGNLQVDAAFELRFVHYMTCRESDDAFFDALAKEWEMVDEDSDHVAWWNLADVAQGLVRRSG